MQDGDVMELQIRQGNKVLTMYAIYDAEFFEYDAGFKFNDNFTQPVFWENTFAIDDFSEIEKAFKIIQGEE